MQGKVDICGVNTARLQVLSQSQMNDLLPKAKKGDSTSRRFPSISRCRALLSPFFAFGSRSFI